MKPEISIVIPMYNAGKIIENVLQSLENQTDKNFEIIIVDDVSTDDSVEIVKKHSLEPIILPKNGGPSRARNVGVKNAKADVILFMDTDVILCPDVIEKLIEMFKDQSINVVAGINDTKNHYNNFISDYENLYISYMYHNLVNFASGFYTCFTVIRKNVFNNVGGFNENIRMSEDTEFGHRLLRKGYKINLNKKIVFSHIKEYTFYTYFKKQIFKMESLLKIKRLYFKQDRFTKTLNTPFLFQLGIPLSLLIPFGLIFSYQVTLLGFLLLFIINYKMLFFMTKKRNAFFLLKAYFFMVINYWFYFISSVYGVIKLIK